MSNQTPESFMEYFRRNYPGPNTIISSPNWHAPKIYSAAIAASAHGDLLEACKVALDSLRAWNEMNFTGDARTHVATAYEQSPEIQRLVKAIAKAEGGA